MIEVALFFFPHHTVHVRAERDLLGRLVGMGMGMGMGTVDKVAHM